MSLILPLLMACTGLDEGAVVETSGDATTDEAEASTDGTEDVHVPQVVDILDADLIIPDMGYPGHDQSITWADLNGDGHGDLLVTQPADNLIPPVPLQKEGFDFGIEAWVAWGPLVGEVSAQRLLRIWDGRSAVSTSWDPPRPVDFDQDGVIDLLFGGCWFAGPFGATTPFLDDTSEEPCFYPDTTEIDLDGDGTVERFGAMVSALTSEPPPHPLGGWHVDANPLDDPSWLVLLQAHPPQREPRLLGDWDGDGFADLYVDSYPDVLLFGGIAAGTTEAVVVDASALTSDPIPMSAAFSIGHVGGGPELELAQVSQDDSLIRILFAPGARALPTLSSEAVVEIQADPSWGHVMWDALQNAGDTNGDGHNDLWVFDSLFLGPLEPGMALMPNDAVLKISGLNEDNYTLFGGADVNEDGVPDVVITSSVQVGPGTYVFYGRP